MPPSEDQVPDRPEPPLSIAPFSIEINEAVLTDLRARIRNTRWPEAAAGAAWEQGTDLEYLKRTLTYWSDDFDWRAQEHALNQYKHFRARIDEILIHFVHERARRGTGIPLILSHGWPSTFVELLPLVPFLTDPEEHGIEGPAFDVVVPSLPGYAFSERPARTGVNYRYVAGLWHRLMRGLGYERYGVHGGDFGSGVATRMALDEPGPVIGVHLSTLERVPYTGAGSRPLSPAERTYLDRTAAWWRAEGGYKAIQETKPQTLAYGLNDSPAGLAAWILEKWRSWSDCDGDPDARFSRDVLLTNVTFYWATRTIASSMRDYFDNRGLGTALGPDDFVTAPTAFALFVRQFVPEAGPPREWVERLYNVRRWTPMPAGGHFAAAEEPERLASDIAGFFAEL
jgi:pimeloyl-ACP methyl ester carboxylesterase